MKQEIINNRDLAIANAIAHNEVCDTFVTHMCPRCKSFVVVVLIPEDRVVMDNTYMVGVNTKRCLNCNLLYETIFTIRVIER